MELRYEESRKIGGELGGNIDPWSFVLFCFEWEMNVERRSDMQERERGVNCSNQDLDLQGVGPGAEAERGRGSASAGQESRALVQASTPTVVVVGGDVWKNRFLHQAPLSPGFFAQTDFTFCFPESIEAIRCESSPFPPKDLAHLPFSCPP